MKRSVRASQVNKIIHSGRFFVQFGSFIKCQLNLDLSVQPALVLWLMFLNGYVLSSKLCFLRSMTFGCLYSKKQMFLVIVVGSSMTLQEHSSDIRNTSSFRRCSKRSIFKYFIKNIIKIQRLENWPLYHIFSSIFFKAQKYVKYVYVWKIWEYVTTMYRSGGGNK